MSSKRKNHRIRYIVCAVFFLIIAISLAVVGFWIPAVVVLAVAVAFLGDARYADKKMSVNQQTAARYSDADPVKHNAQGRVESLELALQEASINAALETDHTEVKSNSDDSEKFSEKHTNS